MSYYGKYRGKVINNVDPMRLGRLMTLAPAISPSPLSWAMPCVPYAGRKVGFFALPPIGANVWIEFEDGDPNYPIWSGCFWSDSEVPAESAVPTTKVLKTETMTLEINDLNAELRLEMVTPVSKLSLVQNSEGLTLLINEVSIKMSLEQIEIKHDPSSIQVSPEGIRLTNAGASAEVAPASVILKNGGASLDITSSSVELKNGGASVALSPMAVSLNNGALEVT